MNLRPPGTPTKETPQTPLLPLATAKMCPKWMLYMLCGMLWLNKSVLEPSYPLTRRGVESSATARHTQIGCTSHRRGSFIPPRGTFVTCVRGVWGAAAAARAGSSAEMRGVEKHPPNPPNHGSRRARTAAAGWLIVERHRV